MSIRRHQVLVRIVFPLGKVYAFLLSGVVLGQAFGVFRLPRPGDETWVNVVAALVVLPLFFVVVYGCGRAFVLLLQRRVLARCPRCGLAAVGLIFLTKSGGDYRYRACGYVRPYQSPATEE